MTYSYNYLQIYNCVPPLKFVGLDMPLITTPH